MADLTGSDRRKLEKMLGMGGGYVLNFSDRTFGDFFDEYRVEIDAERYRARPDCRRLCLHARRARIAPGEPTCDHLGQDSTSFLCRSWQTL